MGQEVEEEIKTVDPYMSTREQDIQDVTAFIRMAMSQPINTDQREEYHVHWFWFCTFCLMYTFRNWAGESSFSLSSFSCC